ncbi:MAG: glycosyltransferase family 4 protein [Elusimicrobiales bacterium]
MKILYIDTPIDPPGGGQVSLFYILKNLKDKFEIKVFLPYKCEFLDWLKNENIDVEVVPLSNLFYKIKKFKPDIIHCNSATTKYTFFSALISKILQIPFIWHNRTLDTAGCKERFIAKLSTKIVVISDTVGEKFLNFKEKVIKIYNAVDTEKFRPGLDIEYLYKEFNINENSKIVGIISRLEPWKGHRMFLEAARIVKDKFGNTIVFLVVGTGEEKYKEELVKLSIKLGLEENVIFTGFRDDIPQIINLCDVIVNPSIEPEPFGRTIIEAMACGKVVITTNLGGPKEIIENRIDGFLVNSDAREIAKILIEVIEDDKLRKRIGKNAREKVIEKFNIIQQVKTIEILYEQMMK